MGLTAATYLGDNTVPILEALVADLVATGVDIRIDPAAGRTSTEARAGAASVDLVWMCGSLSAVLRHEGVLPHEVIGAPVFAGQRAAHYHSVFVARSDGPATLDEALLGRIALNEPESWSGNHGLRHHLGDAWFTDESWTGAHRASIEAVASARCDVAGVDVTVWEHVSTSEPERTSGLRVIDRTTSWPAPPFLVHPRVGVDRATIVATLLHATPPGLAAITETTQAAYDTLLPHRP